MPCNAVTCIFQTRPHIYVHSPCLLNPLAKLVGVWRRVKDSPPGVPGVLLGSLIPEHLVVHSDIITLNGQGSLGGLGFEDEVVVAVRAVLVAIVKLLGVFAEGLFAFLASKRHFEALHERVAFLLLVAFCAVEPFPAWGTRVTLASKDGWMGLKVFEDVQHGDRMATWALRMCLLDFG